MRVFGDEITDLHNTPNGNYPGHVRAGEDSRPDESTEKNAPAASMIQKKSNSAGEAAANAIEAGMAGYVEVKSENMAEPLEISDNYGDNEYVQTEQQSSSRMSKLAYYVNRINGPEDLEFL
jgi:hypothetical protein